MSTRHRRTWHTLIGAPLLSILLLATGCSTQLVYNRLDTLASWYFENLVSLNDGQRGELRAWLERTLAWHRRSELERYSTFLNDLSASVARPGNRASYDAIRDRFENLVDDLVEQTAPEASRLLLQLSPQQIDEMMASLAEKSDEKTEENASAVADQKWHPQQTKTFTKQVRKWTGTVTPEQKLMIAKSIATLEPTYVEWGASQKSWREALREALAAYSGKSASGTPQRVLELLQDPDSRWTPEYEQKIARNRERYLALIGTLDASLTPKQREYLRAELLKMSQQLTQIAET